MDKMKGFYHKTGDFAKLAGLNKRTLHFYDDKGIFKPDHTAPNGYRYYGVNQLDRLALIVTLRDLGVSLPDIRTCLDSRDLNRMQELLQRQDAVIDQMIDQLQQQKVLLHYTLQSNRDYQQYLGQGYLRMELPESCWEPVIDLNYTLQQGWQKAGATVVNYLTHGPYIGMYLSHSGDGERVIFQKRENGSRRMEAGTWLCSYQRMSMEGGQVMRTQQAAEELHAWAAQQGITLEPGTYVEYNDNISWAEGGDEWQYLCFRARIISEAGDGAAR